MAVLNKQITVSKQAFEKRWCIPMSQSLQDAFNDILSNFSETEIDKSYGDEMHQFLKNDKGDIYYFDNFKYVFPKQLANQSEARVLNNSNGIDQFCCVRYNGLSIIVENYDVKGVAEISSYFLTDDVRDLIDSDYMKGDIGDFLLQVSGNNQACIEKLHLGSKIIVKQENGKLVSYDINGNVIDTVPTIADSIYSRTSNGTSFYQELENKVNYYALLDNTYSLENGTKAVENKGPRK